MSGIEDKNKSGSHGGGSPHAAGGNSDWNEAQSFPITGVPATDNTHSSAPAFRNPDAGGNTSPSSGPGAVSSGGGSRPTTNQGQNAPRSRTARQISPKEARGRARTKYNGLPQWRIEQLRAAGRERGKQLTADPSHQRKAGKARAAGTDMKALGAEGNARSIELDPQHQSKAGQGGRGKRKKRSGSQEKGDSKAVPQATDPTTQKDGNHHHDKQRQ